MVSLWLRMGSVLLCASHATVAAVGPFMVGGHFEDRLEGKHHNGGTFTVEAFESNAMVNVIFENGYHEIAGTDGRDSYLYTPFRACEGCRSAGVTNAQAIIAHGRLPTAANFLLQVLWMAYTTDATLLTSLQAVHCPFYGIYSPKDIIVQISNSPDPPCLPASIRWLAPNYGPGAHHYPWRRTAMAT